MATNGSKTVAVTSWDSLVFEWSVTSQSIADNTSTVAWALKLKATSSGRISSTASKSWAVTVDGKSYSGTNTVGIGNNATKTLANGVTVIKHNSNGTKSFDYSFSQQFSITFSGSTIGTISGSGSGTLNTIPRASSLTVSNGTLGTAQTLTINRADSTFKHRIKYECGSASGYAVGSSSTFTSDTSVSWTPPLSLASQNTTGTSVSITLTLVTYNSSGTQVGTATKTISCAIPSSVVPSCTIAVTDPTGFADTYGNPVKGLSKFKVVVTPTLAQGSPVASYSVTANSTKYTAASFTTGVLKSSGANTVSATIKDKRGRSGNSSVSKTVLDYTKPTISKLGVKRCNSDGTSNMQGEYVQVTFTATVTSLNAKNTAKYTLKYKKSTATSYTSVDISALQNVYSATDKTYIFPADTGSSYNVELSVKDNHSTVTRSTNVSTGFTLMHWLANGLGMAIGKVAEISNVFDVGLVTRIREHLNIGNKTGHLDGNTGVFISKEGYIQIQRDSSQGYHPYISFFHDEADYHAGMIRQNCGTKKMDFTGAEGYDFDADFLASGNGYVGTTSSWEDGKSGVRLSKSGGLQIQRSADSSPYIDMFFNGSATYDSRIVHTLATKYMNFYGAGRYVFDSTVEAPTLFSKGHVRIGSDGFDSSNKVVQTYWKDNAVHNLVERSDDGLTSALGWGGSADYATVTKIRGRTCQYQNASGTTALSDERLKKDFTDLEKWDKFFDALEPCAFKMKGGTSGRFHIGFKAQQIEQALAEAGLTTQDFAGFVKMPYVPDKDDAEGSTIYLEAGINPGDDEFGLIYSEFVALNTFKIQRLQEEVVNLKNEIAELKGLLNKQ